MLDDILNSIPEEFIIHWFLKVPMNKVLLSLSSTSYLVKNNLRNEKKASIKLSYKSYGKKLLNIYIHDYGNPYYRGDIVDILGLKLNISPKTKQGFIEILNYMYYDLFIKNDAVIEFEKYDMTSNVSINDIKLEAKRSRQKRAIIKPQINSWNNSNFKYWYNHVKPNKTIAALLLETLIEEVIYPVEQYWLNDNIYAIDTWSKNNPIYAYYYGKVDNIHRFKIYAPFSKKNKFKNNATSPILRLPNNDSNKHLLIVKSDKDYILIKTILKYLKVDDVSMCVVSSESSNINQFVNMFKYLYDNIWVMYDYDSTGIINSFLLSAAFRVHPIFIKHSNHVTIDDIKPDILRGLKRNLNKYKIDFKVDDLIAFMNSYKAVKYIPNDIKDFANLCLYDINKAVKYTNVILNKIQEL